MPKKQTYTDQYTINSISERPKHYGKCAWKPQGQLICYRGDYPSIYWGATKEGKKSTGTRLGNTFLPKQAESALEALMYIWGHPHMAVTRFLVPSHA